MQRISITNPQNIIDGTAKKYYFKLRNTGGPKGDKGDKGDTGSRGPQGPQGDPCTVVVNSTATLEPGSNAYVTNTGSLSNAVLNFGIPQGPRGPQGIQGERGEPGQTGQTGPRGPQGERGTNATVYVGTTSTLNPGSQATVYNSGSDSNAVLNFGIPKGEKGDTGSQGPQGPTGQNFAPTIVAELPATGDSSKLYLTPKAHTTQTATGNPITATVAEEAGAIESFQLDGDTYQQSYTGKNLYKLDTGTYNELVITKNSEGGYVLNGTPTSNVQLNIDIPALSQEHTLSFSASGTSSRVYVRTRDSEGVLQDNLPITQTSGSVTSSKTIATSSLTVTTGETFSNFTIYPQLELGSSATSFEPYCGGVPSPNPDYPQQIKTVTGEQTVEIVGKNLFDKSAVTTGYYIDSNGVLQAYSTFGVSDYIPVVAGQTYTYSGSTNNTGYAGKGAWYDSNKQWLSSQSFGASGQITAPAGASYYRTTIRVQGSGNQEPYLDTYQLELGSTASSYTPYSKQTLPIDLGSIELCKLGTYQDYIYKDGNDWKVHKATSFHQIESSSVGAWTNYSNIEYATIQKSQDYKGYETWDGADVISDHATFDRGSGLQWLDNADRVGKIIVNASVTNYWIGFIKGTSLDSMKSSLDGAKILYPIETPTDTTITDTELIAQLEAIRTASLENGTNTITDTATGSNLAGDMEIGYYGYNPRNRYDKWLWLDINNEYEQIGS